MEKNDLCVMFRTKESKKSQKSLTLLRRTKAYIAAVCAHTGFTCDWVLKFNSICQMTSLFQAMCYVENGQELDWDDVAEGYVLTK